MKTHGVLKTVESPSIAENYLKTLPCIPVARIPRVPLEQFCSYVQVRPADGLAGHWLLRNITVPSSCYASLRAWRE